MRTFVIHVLSTLMILLPSYALSFEETTDTKISDDLFQGGYTKDELDQAASMSKEQKEIMEKFMKGRYSSALGVDSRYGGLMEYHNDNADGITPHDRANNAAESSGDKVGLGKTGLNGDARRQAMAVQRITAPGNCELTKDDQEALKNKNFDAITGALKGPGLSQFDVATAIFGQEWAKYYSPDNNGVSTLKPTVTSVDERKIADNLKAEFNNKFAKKGYILDNRNPSGPTRFRLKCPNVSAIVIDKGAAHGADTGEGHRINDLNQKTFAAGTSDKGPLEGATGATVEVGEKYGAQVAADSARTAIPQEIIAAMRARGMDVWTENDGHTVVTKLPDGTIKKDQVSASPDDLKSEFAWLEAQKKHRLNETWKMLRAERFITGDNYDPTHVSNEIGSLLSQTSGKSDDYRNQVVAEKVADHNVYSGTSVYLKISGTGTNITLGPPQSKAPATAFKVGSIPTGKPASAFCKGAGGSDQSANCYLKADANTLRDSRYAAMNGASTSQLTQAAINAAKAAIESNPAEKAALAKNKARLTSRIKECMARDKWCEQVSLKGVSNLNTLPNKLKNRGITQADLDAGTAYLPVNGNVGNAFKDTREFINVKMEEAMEGPLSQFSKTVDSADFNDYTDSKSDSKFFKQVKRQQAINMKIAKDILDYSEKAYQECLSLGGKNCKRQFDKNNFNPDTMNTVQLFGRNPERDGITLGLDKTVIQGELTRPEMGIRSSDQAPRAPASAPSTPLPARGSAPPSAASPFSLN